MFDFCLSIRNVRHQIPLACITKECPINKYLALPLSERLSKSTDNLTNIICGSLISNGTLLPLRYPSLSSKSNNTRRALLPQSNQQPIQKCINNTHKEPIRLKKCTPKALPTNAPSMSLHAWRGGTTPSPSHPNPLRLFNRSACPTDFSKLSLFQTLFYSSGAKKSHTQGLSTKKWAIVG